MVNRNLKCFLGKGRRVVPSRYYKYHCLLVTWVCGVLGVIIILWVDFFIGTESLVPGL